MAKRNTYKRWDEEEISFLLENYKEFTDEEMCSLLGRPERSVCEKRCRLGLFHFEQESAGSIKGEEWRPIEGFPYDVSSLGRVRNSKGKLLKAKVTGSGYAGLALWIKQKAKHFVVHRLVAAAFIPNPEDKPFVNHKNLNKLHNAAWNLEWVTPTENMQHWADNRKDKA